MLIQIDEEELVFDASDIMVIRNFVGTSSNAMMRLKRAVECLHPQLKGKLFSAEIQKIMSALETSGVVPVICKRIEMQISKDENKKGICTFYYVKNPGRLLERQTERSILDGSYRPSKKVCNCPDKLIMAWGIDKSDTDLSCSQRVCNRYKGNSANFVQGLASAEGCAETRGNE